VGGFSSEPLQEVAGVFFGETETVARNSAMPTVPAALLREWATEQARLIAGSRIAGDEKLQAASLVMLFGGEVSDLPVAVRNGEYLTAKEVEALLRELDEAEVHKGSEIQYDEDEDDVAPKAFKNDFVSSSTLFLVPDRTHSILTVGKQQWPECVPELYLADQPKCCEEAFHQVLKRAWGVEPEMDSDTRVVGEVHGYEISRVVRIYSRPIDPSVIRLLLQ
jgi:hypothetical protein